MSHCPGSTYNTQSIPAPRDETGIQTLKDIARTSAESIQRREHETFDLSPGLRIPSLP